MTRLDQPLPLTHDLPRTSLDRRADALASLLAPTRTAPRVRRRWLPISAAAVGGVAAVFVALQLVSGGTTRTPLHPQTAAAAVLRRAAISAGNGFDPKLGPGQYWMTHVLTSQVSSDSRMPIRSIGTQELRLWTDRDGEGFKVYTPHDVVPVAADRAAWIRLGRPALDTSIAGGGGISPMFGTRGDGSYRTRTATGERRVFPFGYPGPYLSYSQVRALPTNQHDMGERIAYSALDPTSPAEQSFRTFTSITEALAESPLRPVQRAALFRALARVPGVRYDGVHRDAAGRTGARISYNETSPGSIGTIVVSTTFDPTTATILQFDTTLDFPKSPTDGHGVSVATHRIRTTFLDSGVTTAPKNATRLTFTAPGSTNRGG